MRSLEIQKRITDRSDGSIDVYFREISKFPILAPSEERVLFRRIILGDLEAKEKLVRSNLRFVVSVAKQYQQSQVSFLDLISEGNVGLLIAIERFDYSREVKFITFAVWWIRNQILKAINDKYKIIRMPSNFYTVQSKVNKLIDQHRNKKAYWADPTTEEIATLTSINVKLITYLLGGQSKSVISIDKATTEERFSLIDTISDLTYDLQSQHFENSRKVEIERLLQGLANIERVVLILYYGLGDTDKPQSLTEIGKLLGYSNEGVRVIKNRALSKLRKLVQSKSFFLEYI